MSATGRKGSSGRAGCASIVYTSEWYPGAPLEKRLAWRHEPDTTERWDSMDYDERMCWTTILMPRHRGVPLSWELLLEGLRARQLKTRKRWDPPPGPFREEAAWGVIYQRALLFLWGTSALSPTG